MLCRKHFFLKVHLTVFWELSYIPLNTCTIQPTFINLLLCVGHCARITEADKTDLPGPRGEAEGALIQCDVCVWSRSVRTEGEIAQLRKYCKNWMRGLFKVRGNTFVCCKARLRAVSWITGETSRTNNVIYHVLKHLLWARQGRNPLLLSVVSKNQKLWLPYPTSQCRRTTDTFQKLWNFPLQAFAKAVSSVWLFPLPQCLQAEPSLHPGGATSPRSLCSPRGACHGMMPTLTCSPACLHHRAGRCVGRACVCHARHSTRLTPHALKKDVLIKLVDSFIPSGSLVRVWVWLQRARCFLAGPLYCRNRQALLI